MRFLKYLMIFTLGAALLSNCGDACDDVDCGANGTCLDGTCDCDEGYSGTNCQTNVCDALDCGPNGTCDTTTGACLCDEGYSGDNCEINVCDTVDCGPNGTCDTTTGACQCDEGYEGDNCETETRSNYYGSYQGDIVPCVPAFLAALIPADQLETLMTTDLDVFESATGISYVTVGSMNTVLNLNIDANLNDPEFTIEEFTQEVDVEGTMVVITGSGTGRFLDTENLELTLFLNFNLDILTFDSDCVTIFTKQ